MIRFTDVVPETKPQKAPEREPAPRAAAPSETPKPKTPRKPKKSA